MAEREDERETQKDAGEEKHGTEIVEGREIVPPEMPGDKQRAEHEERERRR